MSAEDRRIRRFPNRYFHLPEYPEPEDEIENSENRALSCEFLQSAGSVRYLVFKGETASEYLTSSIWCMDLTEYR